MLEYPLDEAKELLKTNMETAQKTLENVENDLDYLRYQVVFSSHYIDNL